VTPLKHQGGAKEALIVLYVLYVLKVQDRRLYRTVSLFIYLFNHTLTEA
jgi:hypothetical protein